MSKKRTKNHSKKKNKKIKPTSSQTIDAFDQCYDVMFSVRAFTRDRFNNYNMLISSLLDQYKGNEDQAKEIDVYDGEYNLFSWLTDENINKLTKKRNSLNLYSSSFKKIAIHEEIIWFFNGNYEISNDGDFLQDATSVKWNIGSNSHKSPDLIFMHDGKKIGVEVTRVRRPSVTRLKKHSDIQSVLKQLSQEADKTSFQLLPEVIANKANKISSSHTSYESCDEYILIVLTNPIGGDKYEFANKVKLQLMATDISKNNDVFSKIFIA